MIIDATTTDDMDLTAEGLTVVDFYRDDCRFCDMLAPVLDDVAFELPVARFVKVNCSRVDGLAAAQQIQTFPTTKLFKNGEVVDSIVGFVPASVLIERIGKHLY
jgi:thioredoxin 1